MIEEIINKVSAEQDLSEEEAYNACNKMMAGDLSEEQIGTILMNLAAKGETTEELIGMAKAMREFMVKVDLGNEKIIDTCGTGGSGLSRINTSTLSAFVLATGGVKIAKHGNRASSGRCGSFDLLEAFGAKIELNEEQVKKTFAEFGVSFFLAPLYHPAMKHVGPVRKKLGIRTIFNFLGPLCNPAEAKHQILGVSDLDMAEKMARVLLNLGNRESMIVHGQDGLDEITLSDSTDIFEINSGSLNTYDIEPSAFNLARADSKELTGGGAQENKNFAIEILKGEESPRANLVIANAAAGFYVMQKVNDLEEGASMAKEILKSKKAYRLMKDYVAYTETL